jgi:hypothetical protein
MVCAACVQGGRNADEVPTADTRVESDAGGDALGDPALGPDLDATSDATSDASGDPDAMSDDAETDAGSRARHLTEPVLYGNHRIQSPITGYVADNLRDIAARRDDLNDRVFMKVGASGTVNTHLLYCFAGDYVDFDDGPTFWETVDYFLQGEGDDIGDEGDTTPFDRATYAAVSGRTARWAMSGDPSPLEQEIEAIKPRFALINYGANDMQMGTTYLSAMPSFYANLSDLLDQVIDHGIVPVLTNVGHRTDIASAGLWVPTYNALINGIAQARQIPVIDLYLAADDIPDFGLTGDGLHSNAYSQDGRSRSCVFTEEALQYGYNVRNLITIEAFDRLRRAVVEHEPFLDEEGDFLDGDGSPGSPFQIRRLPFAHLADTSTSRHRNLDEYTGCDASQDESGPEYLYQLNLGQPANLRFVVMDRGSVDIDLHLLSEGTGEGDCLDRAHQLIEGSYAPGTYYLSLDSFVSAGGEAAGEYLVVVLECEPGDEACDRD